MKFLISIVFAAAIAAAALYFMFFSGGAIVENMPVTILDEHAVDAKLVAQTDTGKVLGFQHEKGVLQFASIPFAAPPVGQLRFQPPTPRQPWTGVLDAREMGPSCIQEVSFFDTASQREQSEDCLWLTLNTPNLDTKKRPVIVWIHGGGLYAGGNGDPTYDGAIFSSRGDIVFVNLQYRLGVLGWLDVSHLGGDDAKDSSLAGQQDVLAGLAWVQRNIANFGGDPDNITIMGESAGAYLVASLLWLPEAQPLFHKAILQSGVYDVWEMSADRQELTQFVMDSVGAKTLEELRQVDGKSIQQAQAAVTGFATSKGIVDPMPWYGPRGITAEDVKHAADYGKPVLHGTLKDEYHFFTLLMSGDDAHKQLANSILGSLGLDESQISTLVTQTQKALPERKLEDVYVDVITATYMHYPHMILADAQSVNAPVYTYLIDWTAPKRPDLGAFHALDLPIIFGNFEPWSWALGDNPPVKLSNDMQDAWIAFARTGNPTHENIPNWPVYDTEKRHTMRFGDTYQIQEDPLGWVREIGGALDAFVKASK
ncbi:MAG: carboxylesterase family protein [Pseudomonadota bacterium]